MKKSRSRSKGADPATQGAKNGGSDIQKTPPHIIDALLGLWPQGITLDPCSNEGKPNIPARFVYTVRENGLLHPWSADTVFLNNPYSENLVWAEKFCRELKAENFNELVSLNKCDPRVKWFGLYQNRCNAFCMVEGYLKFSGVSTGAKYPSIIWYFGQNSDAFQDKFSDIGWCYEGKS